MKKIYQLLGLNKPLPEAYGIEIEAEGKNMVEVGSQFWKTENDGSLRGHYPDRSAEFVLRKPIHANQVDVALDELIGIQKEAGAEFDFSFRTSVHIHVNVQEMTEEQVMNMIYTYLLIEEPMMNYCGRARKGNRFCLRVVDADNIIDILKQGFTDGIHRLMEMDVNALRYSSMNVGALSKYGSLEFRGMRGNMDKEILTKWITALGNLKAYALSKKTPMDILEEFQNSKPEDFLQMLMGDLYEDFKYPRMVREIQRSFSLAIDLPYSYRNANVKRKAIEERVAEEAPDARKPRARAIIFDDL